MLKTFRLLILIALVQGSVQSTAQDQSTEDRLRKKSFYAHWGYNRAHYQQSEIHFKGDNFDFTISDVRAHDRPSPFDPDLYLNPTKLFIPQTNFRAGYFIRENTSISLGWDHMKYIVQRYQRVQIDGEVSTEISEDFAGTYDNEGFDLSPAFLMIEHSDGLNYVRAGVEQHTGLWHDERKRFQLDLILGASFGPVLTWTDATMNGTRYENWLHLSGWGVSGQLATRIRYKKLLYLQYQHLVGYMRLGDIIFKENSDRASQTIRFNEQSIVLGLQVPVFIGGNPNK